MARFPVVHPQSATGETREVLEAVQQSLGATPNFIRVFANSPAALKGFVGLHSALGGSTLSVQTRERIALALAEDNGCQYCVSAHSAIARKHGLSDAEIISARHGGSADVKAEAAVRFALAVMENRGEVTNAELAAVRAAGYSDGEIIEIIADVALNFFTNALGKASQVEIDFPVVELLPKHKAACCG